MTHFAELQNQLQTREQELRDEIQAHRAQLVEPASATGNTFIAGSERAVADTDDELEVARLQHAQQELDEVSAALQRLQAGVFGICQNCQAPVGLARLRALPQARLCMRCQRAADDNLRYR